MLMQVETTNGLRLANPEEITVVIPAYQPEYLDVHMRSGLTFCVKADLTHFQRQVNTACGVTRMAQQEMLGDYMYIEDAHSRSMP